MLGRMEDTVEKPYEIRSADGNEVFRLVPQPDVEGRPYMATVSSRSCTAGTRESLFRSRFIDFVVAIAEDWRGWTNLREFAAHPHGQEYSPPALRLGASNDGRGHVTLRVEIGYPWIPDMANDNSPNLSSFGLTEPGSWCTEIVMGLEAGQLDRIAAKAKGLPFDSVGWH